MGGDSGLLYIGRNKAERNKKKKREKKKEKIGGGGCVDTMSGAMLSRDEWTFCSRKGPNLGSDLILVEGDANENPVASRMTQKKAQAVVSIALCCKLPTRNLAGEPT